MKLRKKILVLFVAAVICAVSSSLTVFASRILKMSDFSLRPGDVEKSGRFYATQDGTSFLCNEYIYIAGNTRLEIEAHRYNFFGLTTEYITQIRRDLTDWQGSYYIRMPIDYQAGDSFQFWYENRGGHSMDLHSVEVYEH